MFSGCSCSFSTVALIEVVARLYKYIYLLEYVQQSKKTNSSNIHTLAKNCFVIILYLFNNIWRERERLNKLNSFFLLFYSTVFLREAQATHKHRHDTASCYLFSLVQFFFLLFYSGIDSLPLLVSS